MTAQNDDFDLPRWQTQHHHDQLSSASAPSQSSYIYSAASQQPPPPPTALISPQRLQPAGSSRQHRISQLLEPDQQLPSTTSPYHSTGQTQQLSRSASFGGSNNSSTTSRARRHHQPDDLEGAFHSDSQTSRQQSHVPTSNSFYPSSVNHHTQPMTSTAGSSVNNSLPTTAQYSDIFYTGSGAHASKRSQDASTRTGRSPLRTGNAATSNMIDPYSQQAQYSPTTSTYPYGPPSDQRNLPSGAYHSHSRAHSIVKTEVLTP